MKRLFVIIAATLLAVGGMAQRKVAVCVSAPESVSTDAQEILASELANAINLNHTFQASDRTEDFARNVQNLQDNGRICNYGKQLGVDFVCVAQIHSFRDSYYVKTRLLDVRTQEVINSASQASAMVTMNDILTVASSLAQRLLAMDSIKAEFSQVGYASRNNCYLINIDNTGSNTVVSFKLIDTKGTLKWSLSANTVILDRATGNQYKLLSTQGISTDHSENFGLGIHEFSAVFEKMPYTATNIDIIEPHGWAWTDIVLKNFGMTGMHQFVDDTQQKYADMMKERELMQRQEAEFGTIINVVDTYRSYLVTITNEQYGSSFIIELEGKTIGRVPYRSTVTFRLPLEKYGLIKAIQADGWLLSPAVYKFNVPPMKQAERVQFTIPRP